jgi:hypothetical protein
MRNHWVRATIGLSALLSVAGLMAANAVGCGSDDSTNSHDAGHDVTLDTRGDTNPPPADSGPDTAIDATDGGSDAGMIVDATLDGDAGYLVPVGNFPQRASQAYCQRLQACCCVQTSPTAWDAGGCESDLARGYEIFSLAQYAQVSSDAGFVPRPGVQIMLDPDAAASCINQIGGIACTGATAPEWTTVERNCFNAMVPQVPLGAGCTVHGECQQGYCNPRAGDGGLTGACVPLLDAGAPCVYGGYGRSEDCTYLGLGNPANYCETIDDAGDQACAPAQALDAGCQTDEQCQTFYCAGFTTASCSNQVYVSDPGTAGGICQAYGCLQ